MMQRRGFLGAILAAGMAPAYVGASVLMPVRSVLAAPSTVIAPATAVLTNGHGLQEGDLFTIAGIAGTFRIISELDQQSINFSVYESASFFDRLMARLA